MSGPVQVLVVGFEELSFSGEVLAELDRLSEAGTVRLVDVLLVHRDEDGTFDTLAAPEGFPADLGKLAADLLGATDELGADSESGADTGTGTGTGTEPDDDGWSLADIVEPGALAAVALIEHLWAGPLVDAIASAGGRPLGELWLSAEDRARLPI